MYCHRLLVSAIASTTFSSAVIIISPANNSSWTTTGKSHGLALVTIDSYIPSHDMTGPNTIQWSAQPNDPSFFNIRLLQNNSSNFTPIPHLLPSNGTIATGLDVTSSYSVLTPSWYVLNSFCW